MSKKLKLKKIGNMSDGRVIFRVEKQKYRGESFGTKSVFYSEKADVNLMSMERPNNNGIRYSEAGLYLRMNDEENTTCLKSLN